MKHILEAETNSNRVGMLHFETVRRTFLCLPKGAR